MNVTHTPGLFPGLFVPQFECPTASAVCNDIGKILHYRCDVYELGGGASFSTHGVTAAEAESEAKKIIETCNRAVQAERENASAPELLVMLKRMTDNFEGLARFTKTSLAGTYQAAVIDARFAISRAEART